ncbi:MAG: metallophosphoesterase [candidate division Zixibacteria bacterium]|nr:metallophosphoesterase [candidate division Zixibacteria bacterium]
MKTSSLITFLTIALAIYGSVNLYIGIRGWQSFPHGSSARWYFLAAFLFVSLSFIAGRFMERASMTLGSYIFVWIGSVWLAVMVYAFMAVLALDILRTINHFLPFFPDVIAQNYAKAKQITALSISGLVAVVVAVGYINAMATNIQTLDLTIPKGANGRKDITIVAASDMHLGTIIGRWRCNSLVEQINGLKPDLILLAGDIVDEDLGRVVQQNLGEELSRLDAPLGVYGINGNHEYIGGVERADAYLRDHGITMLRDSVVTLDGGISLVGRDDRSANWGGGPGRKPLEVLMASVDKSLPVILMDHQPFGLGEGVANGVDLQLSGHTHHGQLWPFNYITDRIYEVSRGYKKIGNTNVYVSTGFGTWGPPVRLGNRPEIVKITLHFRP